MVEFLLFSSSVIGVGGTGDNDFKDEGVEAVDVLERMSGRETPPATTTLDAEEEFADVSGGRGVVGSEGIIKIGFCDDVLEFASSCFASPSVWTFFSGLLTSRSGISSSQFLSSSDLLLNSIFHEYFLTL